MSCQVNCNVCTAPNAKHRQCANPNTQSFSIVFSLFTIFYLIKFCCDMMITGHQSKYSFAKIQCVRIVGIQFSTCINSF